MFGKMVCVCLVVVESSLGACSELCPVCFPLVRVLIVVIMGR